MIDDLQALKCEECDRLAADVLNMGTQIRYVAQPPYIVLGQWKDDSPPLNSPYQNPFNQGRQHPYGIGAWMEQMPNGETRIYPNKEAAKADECPYAQL